MSLTNWVISANNLTERAVHKFQYVLRGRCSPRDHVHTTRVTPETRENIDPDVVTDQLFFDSQSKQQQEFQSAASTSDAKSSSHDARKLKQRDKSFTTIKQYIDSVFTNPELQTEATFADYDNALPKMDPAEAAMYSVENKNVCSNPEEDDSTTVGILSSSNLSSQSLFSDTFGRTSLTLTRKDVATSSMSCCR